jgi:phosphoenolpyruvate carboxykinase (GTP)
MPQPGPGEKKIQNPHVLRFVEESAQVCQPDRIVYCNGSVEERAALTREAVSSGVLIELNQSKRPGCYLHRSNPNDVARVESLTFICAPTREEAGPLNNWVPPKEMYALLRQYLDGAMRGRTMYVIPYLMGPAGSALSKVGVEITDSIYVVLSMGIRKRWATLRD